MKKTKHRGCACRNQQFSFILECTLAHPNKSCRVLRQRKRRTLRVSIAATCLFVDNAGYIPAAAVSVPTSPHIAAPFSGFFPSPVVLSSQMLKNAPLVAQGLHCLASITLGAVMFGTCSQNISYDFIPDCIFSKKF